MKARSCLPADRHGGRPKLSEIDQREQHLIDAASETFLRIVFDATTMDAIAQSRLQSSRSRLFDNVEWSQTASSTASPTNYRNRRSNSMRSIRCRSERIP